MTKPSTDPNFKRCKRCNVRQHVTKYRADPVAKGGYRNLCNVCRNNDDRGRRRRRERKLNHSVWTAWLFRSKYGMTFADFDAMLERQGGGCAICEGKEGNPGRGDRLHVDHDHATNRVRGLLCAPCNKMLGLARDDIARLAAGIEYLKKNSLEVVA